MCSGCSTLDLTLGCVQRTSVTVPARAACMVHVLRPKSYRAEELLDLPIDLPKSSSTWALFRRALRPPAQWPESSQAATRLGRGALRPPQAPSELSGWLDAAGELSGRGKYGAQCLFGARVARRCACNTCS